MDEGNESTERRSVAKHGVAFALVAAVAFCGGLLIGGSGGTAAALSSHLPLIGDGLDPTPDQEANLTDFWKAWNALTEHYVSTHASSTPPTSKEKVYGAIAGLAASYGDPYTVFLPPKEAKIFRESISGKFAGVGMEIDVKDGHLTVIAPLKGTPAERSGILAGDLITAIDGKPTDGIAVDQAVAQIRGPVGTVVMLSMVRDGKPLEFKVTRAIIQVPETEDGLDASSNVYHIALYEFTENSGSLFSQALARFRASGSDKLVIDLRGNPGGYLDAAVDIASHFLPKGATVVTEDFGGKRENNVHTSLGYGDGAGAKSLVVLIDGGSASASEIVAGALQDSHRATIVGTKSYGKGSVQTLIPIDDGSLKVTVARWITPSGHWIMGNGITPDIIASTTLENIQAKNDVQMKRAVQFLTTGK